ncbi:BAAT/acyl-CoA thioester hydrolase protein [Oesophagostomum dentatum]|uniref:BAAT/acyl-CoA thioester hydrolase protein n=1 Tax=Oesophagostomum dentatum TaxID=61180 RepID=A0A0B1TI04_OESDE|nr:BAAT/acyl-CoA thioester hydrolase protein [Oesophagostomum dentatum]
MLHIDLHDSLMKEQLRITVEKLTPKETCELVLRLNHPMGTFASYAIFEADEKGEVDLSKTAPLRGTYCGIRPMGLFEGLMPCEDFRFGNYCKCTPPNPFSYDVELRDSTGHILSSIPIIKRWIHPAVIRREIEEDGICGTLFIPPGNGPFPTIIDMSGTGGGINEQKGATLSSEGFCVLSLAFFQYKTLVSELNDVDMDYFEKAIHWLTAQPFTRNEIGIQGVSFGGLIVNMLAIRHPEIKAVCSINGSLVLSDTVKIKEHGEFLPCADTPIDMIYYINQALCYDKSVKHMQLNEATDVRIETAPRETAFRFVASLDDLSTPTMFITKTNEKKLRDSGHYVEVEYASGGHLMEPPYFLSHQVVYAKFAGCIQAYGGEPCLHGASQARVWPNTVEFFKRFLGEPQALEDYRRNSAAIRSHL